MAAETAERVRAVIEELDFVPRAAARGLASHRTHTLGLLLPEIGRDFFLPLLKGIEREARRLHYDLLIQTTEMPDAARDSLGGLGEHNTDGLIIFTDSVEDAALCRLFADGFPVVLLHQTPPAGTRIPAISIDNESGAQSLVDHLVDVHHCQHIAFLRGPDGNEDSEWRERGYRQSLANHGIAFDAALVGNGGYDEEQAEAAVRAWLDAGLMFEAVFAGDDDAALGALAALRAAGKRVPQDVAVVGFDDVTLSRHVVPALTTVHSPIEQVGQEAVLQLIRCISNEAVEPVTLLPTQLVIRQSCGCS